MRYEIISISNNLLDNYTKITLEIYEMCGTVEKLKDKLILTLKGKYNNNEDLFNAMEEELNKNGFNYLPIVE